MKITLITSNQNRHKYLTNLLSKISKELFVVQEKKNFLDRRLVEKMTSTSEIKKKYFKKVIDAENKIFGTDVVLDENIKEVMTIELGELNKFPLKKLDSFLKSDIYIIFGSSFLKGDLIDFLIKNKALNIHMGISPYYRGSDCNFWALYDENPHLVGATIHYISKGLDSGPILYHAISDKHKKDDSFLYAMSTVRSAFVSLVDRIKNQSILKYKPIFQNKNYEIRYSKKIDFNDQVIENFFNKKINLQSKRKDLTLLKDPFVLNN
jgi:folate-dependent phosphoribosylglycinamide formyltransferase PurN